MTCQNPSIKILFESFFAVLLYDPGENMDNNSTTTDPSTAATPMTPAQDVNGAGAPSQQTENTDMHQVSPIAVKKMEF